MLPGNAVGKLNREEDMSYSITTEVEQGYVKLVASGEQTLESNKELVFRVLEACAENNLRQHRRRLACSKKWLCFIARKVTNTLPFSKQRSGTGASICWPSWMKGKRSNGSWTLDSSK